MAVAPVRRIPTAPPPEPGVLERVGNFFQQAFPAINAARVSIRDGVDDAVSKGEYARAAGNAVRGVVTYPAAAVNDTLAPVGQAIMSAGPFVGGILGSKGDTTVVKTQPAAAMTSPRQAVTQALAQGRAAGEPEVSPQDALGRYISSVLSKGATIREAQALGALVPAVTKGAPRAKDTVLGQTAALSEAIFNHAASEIDAAEKAGTITADQAKLGREKATAEWFARNGGLVGFDPSKLVQAQMLQGADGED